MTLVADELAHLMPQSKTSADPRTPSALATVLNYEGHKVSVQVKVNEVSTEAGKPVFSWAPHPPPRGPRCQLRPFNLMLGATVVLFFMLTSLVLVASQLTDGSRTVAVLKSYPYACDQEGDMLFIKGITNNPCIKCVCKDGTAHCITNRCMPRYDCPVVVGNDTSSCCKKCKDCTYLDQVYRNGEQWMSTQDSCRRLTCKGGVVTGARIQCVTTCSNPERFVGFCCPVCPKFNNLTALSSIAELTTLRDPCVQCQCDTHWCHCFRTACPVLDCAPSLQYTPENACCPECKVPREEKSTDHHSCIFRDSEYQYDQSFRPDPCTLCVCQDGAVVCRRFVCPNVDCPERRLHYDSKLCCPRCRDHDLQMCTHDGQWYQDSQVWKIDSCTKCRCSNGKVACNAATCPHSFACPRGYKMKTMPGECCPKCVEKEATCTVFGDPHYQTFDGREFSFQGSCRYVLTEECVLDPERENWSPFTVIVANELRDNDTYSWTRHVSIRLSRDTRVALLPGKKVRINRRLVVLPYVELGLFSIMFDKSHNVLMRANIGLKIVWDGNSYAEVSVTPNYKGRLCGLCGNYNHNAKDDFVTRNGFQVTKALTFGRSWRIGPWKACKSLRDRMYHRNLDQLEGRQFGSGARWKRRHQSRLAWKMLNGAGLTVFGGGTRTSVGAGVKATNSSLDQERSSLSSSLPNDLIMSDDSTIDNRGSKGTTTMNSATSKLPVMLRHLGLKTPCKKGEQTDKCLLLKSNLFAACHSVVPVHSYLKSCIIDSCACPAGRNCYCESLLAYARRCKREGVSVEWQLQARCSFDKY